MQLSSSVYLEVTEVYYKTKWKIYYHDYISMTYTTFEIGTSNTPPQMVCSPREVAKCFALILGKALVRVSVTILSVGQ